MPSSFLAARSVFEVKVSSTTMTGSAALTQTPNATAGHPQQHKRTSSGAFNGATGEQQQRVAVHKQASYEGGAPLADWIGGGSGGGSSGADDIDDNGDDDGGRPRSVASLASKFGAQSLNCASVVNGGGHDSSLQSPQSCVDGGVASLPQPYVSSSTLANGNGICTATNGSTAATDNGRWTIGLINGAVNGYLSAETFGHRINANGKALKKKQLWVLEPSGDGETVVLRSHLNKFVAVDQFGNVTCDQTSQDGSTKFEISVCEDFSGRWAFKSVSRGYFLGATADAMQCVAKCPSDAELWHVHLAARPQVNIRSVGRKRFAQLSPDTQDEVRIGATVPWGEQTLFTLEFREDAKKYAVHTCNGMYLMRDGQLTSRVTDDCHFAIEYHGGYIALRDLAGHYLAPIGARAVLKTRAVSVTRDELFALEDSLPQANFVSKANGKFVSVKQGVDVTANQEDVSDYETFQLEYECSSGGGARWYVRTMQDKYFVVGQSGGGVQATERHRCPDAQFTIVWHADGTVAFRAAANGKHLATKKSGHVFANAESDADDNARFYFYLANRPILVLKCDQGFVGRRSLATLSPSASLTGSTDGSLRSSRTSSPSRSPRLVSTPPVVAAARHHTPDSPSQGGGGGLIVSGAAGYRLECNRANYEMLHVERGERGRVYFRAQNGKYVRFASESAPSGNSHGGLVADCDGIKKTDDDSDDADAAADDDSNVTVAIAAVDADPVVAAMTAMAGQAFYMELRDPTHMCLRSATCGRYVNSQMNGGIAAVNKDRSLATLWEY